MHCAAIIFCISGTHAQCKYVSHIKHTRSVQIRVAHKTHVFCASACCTLSTRAVQVHVARKTHELRKNVSHIKHTCTLQRPIHVLVGAGDPVKCDSLWQLPYFMNWLCLPDLQARMNHPFTPEMEEQVQIVCIAVCMCFDVYLHVGMSAH